MKKLNYKTKLYESTHYYLPIYGVNINIAFNKKDYKKLCKKYQDYKHDYELSNNGDCLMNSENNEVTIGIFNGCHGTIVHELTHCCLFILHSHHMDPNDSHGEALAYLQQHLYLEVVERMEKV